MKYNINEIVEVKLTEYGESVLQKENLSIYNYNYYPYEMKLKVELWALIQIFGNYIGMGFTQCFENNEIEFIGA